MFKFLPTAFLVRYSPFSITVWKWNASIKSRDKENLTSNFDHFVNLLTLKNSLENGRKIKTSWESWLFTNFPPRIHRSTDIWYFRSDDKVLRQLPIDLQRLNFRTRFPLNFTKWGRKVMCLKLTEIGFL